MTDFKITPEMLEERYKKVLIRVEETKGPFHGEIYKRYVCDCIHEGSIYYVHIEFSPFGTTYSGDMGCFMFQPGYGVGIFKGKEINPFYWSEKISAAGRDYFEKDIDEEIIDKAYKDFILAHLEGEFVEDYFELAKKALEMSESEFEKWAEELVEKDEDEEEFVEDLRKIRDADYPSSRMDYPSYEEAYKAIERCLNRAGINADFEDVGYIADNAINPNYRFLYACHLLQWVSNKIVAEDL